MADDLPGFIPRVLQLDDVSLLRADEAVLNAMVRISAITYDQFSPPSKRA